MTSLDSLFDLLDAVKNLCQNDWRAELSGDGWHLWHKSKGIDVEVRSLCDFLTLVVGERVLTAAQAAEIRNRLVRVHRKGDFAPLFSLLHAVKNAAASGWRIERSHRGWAVRRPATEPAIQLSSLQQLLDWAEMAVDEPLRGRAPLEQLLGA